MNFMERVRRYADQDETLLMFIKAYDNDGSILGKQEIIKEISLYIKNVGLEDGIAPSTSD